MQDSLYQKNYDYGNDMLKNARKTLHFGQRFYSVFRLKKKFYTTNSFASWQKHMEREVEVNNADRTIDNEILIGTKNVKEDAKTYLKDCKIRKNNVLARDLLLTATHGFFNMPIQDINTWVELQVTWLKKEFGDNCIYATLHKDERTYHIHALVIPKFENDKGEHILSNKRYFDGREALSNWQTNYAFANKEVFHQLNRGIKWSKAGHIEVKHFYAMINQKLDEKDLKQVLAHSVNSELLEIKLKALDKTMETYKTYWKKSDAEKKLFKENNIELIEQLKELKKDKLIYKEAIETLANIHKIPQNAVLEVIKYAEKELSLNISVKNIESERELEK